MADHDRQEPYDDQPTGRASPDGPRSPVEDEPHPAPWLSAPVHPPEEAPPLAGVAPAPGPRQPAPGPLERPDLAGGPPAWSNGAQQPAPEGIPGAPPPVDHGAVPFPADLALDQAPPAGGPGVAAPPPPQAAPNTQVSPAAPYPPYSPYGSPAEPPGPAGYEPGHGPATYPPATGYAPPPTFAGPAGAGLAHHPGAVYPAEDASASSHADQPYETADSLSPETLLRGRRRAPGRGWRRAVYLATVGLVHPGESPAELRRRELVARACTPVATGHHRVAVLSLKGGVGKTTTTVGLGATLASLRGDRVIAVDANPDRGTLSDKVRLETAATVRDLLNEREQIQRYADVRAFTSQAPSRLEVLASDRDPTVSVAFSEYDYRAVAQVLEHFYSICITDCGTGLLHSAMAGVLGLADQLVLVSSVSVDGARSASATLDWLEAHHYGPLVRGAVVVLSMVRPKNRTSIDLDRLEQHFAARTRAVVRIPYDPHLEEGAEIDLDRLNPQTREAYLVLAATVGDGFAWR